MLSLYPPRAIFVAMVLFIAGCFAIALYTQYVGGLTPCPLCMAQRAFYILTAAIALLAAIHNRAVRTYAVLCLAAALAGVAVAARQVWLQHLPPDQVPACGPGLDYMLQTLPFGQVLIHMLKGDGNCAIVNWRLWGLSMAEWSLLCFLALTATSVALVWRPHAYRDMQKLIEQSR